jgi:ribosomal protein S18 acetylase RimI-like enzyme
MNIRPMVESDVAPLARLMANTPLWQRYGVTEESAARRLRDGLAQGASIAVAEVDDEPAGFVWYAKRGAFNRSGYILLLGVRPDVREQGIGQALMEHAEAVLFTQASDVFLLVSDFNRDAQRFYTRRGYYQVGAIPDYVVPGVIEVILRKKRA